MAGEHKSTFAAAVNECCETTRTYTPSSILQAMLKRNLEAVHECMSCLLRRVCIAAFAQAVLAGETQPGVWFPEEPEAVQDRPALLKLASRGCTQFQINRPPWAIETDPTQLGMGFYW